jgi:hypothetical protein
METPLPEPKDQSHTSLIKMKLAFCSIAKKLSLVSKYKTPNEGIIKLTIMVLDYMHKMSVDARTLKDIINIFIFRRY